MRFLRVVFSIVLFNLAASVDVSVYYEALCPDSVRFIVAQLQPNYGGLKDHINLDLVPYGFASSALVDGKWYFQCQHGPKECLSNKYQSCALALNAANQDKRVEFVSCVEASSRPSDVQTMKRCALNATYDWAHIANCATTAEGDEALLRNGNKTDSVRPKIAFIPTVVFNGKFDQTLQDLSQVNFKAAVCDQIVGEKPAVCGANSQGRTSRVSAYDW